MRKHRYSGDYDFRLLAEVYDQSETETDDVELIRKLVDGRGPLSILEVFSGTGRIFIPLLADGHTITAIEMADAMNNRAQARAKLLGPGALNRLCIKRQDVLDGNWGEDYDLVVIGCNALYELPSAAMQERCIELAAHALRPGGRLYLGNDHWKRPIAGELGSKWTGHLEGIGADGAYGTETAEVIGVDEKNGVLQIKRTWYTRTSDGHESTVEYMGTKRPVRAEEAEEWLEKHGFRILQAFGNRAGDSFTPDSDRAIFWAAFSTP